MAELKKKIQTRNGHRLFMRGVITKVKELLPETDLEFGPDVTFKLEAHRILLEKQLKPIQTLDREIAELLDADSIEKETLQALDFEAAIQERICWIDAVLLSCGKSDPVDVVTNVNNSHNSSVVGNEGSSDPQSTSNQSSSQKKVKLPKLLLHNFHGSVTDLFPFWESFDSAINQNSDLSEIEKFQYLRSLLQGSALNVIS